MRTSCIALLLMAAVGCATREPQAGSPGQTATASLASAIATARQQAPEGEPRRIWADKDTDGSGAPSPDGTLLSYTAWDQGALGIRDLRTGENRLLTPAGNPSSGFPETSAFSSDGKQLAYRWVAGKGVDLRVVDVAGSEPRIVVPQSPDIASIAPLQWTADGREILVGIVRADRTFQIAFANVASGALRGIRTFQWGQTGSGTAALSHDGQYLAMSVPSATLPNVESDLLILTRDGGSEVARIENAGVDRVAGWAADGRLFYQSTRGPAGVGTTSSLFAVQTRDGKPAGPHELVKSDMSRTVYSRVSDDGRLFYTIFSGSYDVYVAGIDVANARVLSPAVRATHRLIGFNQGIDWTANGRYAAYLVREGAAPASPGVVAIRDEESGDVREIRPDLDYINAAIRWSPDGRSILVQATDSKGRHGLYAIDAVSGKLTPIVYGNPKGGVFHRPQWAPDGRSIYYLALDRDHPTPRILHRDLESGAEREVYAEEQLRPTFALSGDGATLAVTNSATDGDVISLVSATGGPARELLRLTRPERVSAITWSRDGKYLLFSKARIPDRMGELWRVSIETGAALPLGLAIKDMMGLRMHPDGRRIGYTGGESQTEVWVLETSKTARAQASTGSGR
jgi:Tol biopolymer transport system component